MTHARSPSLHQATSDLSDYTVDSTSTVVETPQTAVTPGSPVQHRPGYRRIASINDQDTAYHGSEDLSQHSDASRSFGLGIKNLERLPSPTGTPATPGSANPLLSPESAKFHKAYKPLDNDPILEANEIWDENVSRAEPFQPFVADSETEALRSRPTAPTVQSFEPPGTVRISFPIPASTFEAIMLGVHGAPLEGRAM